MLHDSDRLGMLSDDPIISSLLDMDFYKFTMGQVVWKHFTDMPVAYGFRNRTGKPLRIAEVDLRRELDFVRRLRFTTSDLHYLRGTNEYSDRMFSEEYLTFLRTLQLPDYDLTFDRDGNFELIFRGTWANAIYWETLALSIVNELHSRAMMRDKTSFGHELTSAVGVTRLASKLEVLRRHPDVTFTDFGTRRRFSRAWHDNVVMVLAEELPSSQFRGTSNVWLAMKHGLTPMGTSAHEMFMIMAGIAQSKAKMLNQNVEVEIRKSHGSVLDLWWKEYGHGLSIALTDTFGTDFFFSDMGQNRAMSWKGLRQDSGDPIEFGEKTIKFYEKLGIDPESKVIVFSDGLDVDTIVKLHTHFRGRINTTYGWGTNLTNDLGISAKSLVVKPIEASGQRLVKLSDNIAKATGRPEDIELYKRVFGHTNNDFKECVY